MSLTTETDAARILQELGDWTTMADLARTMRLRDRWSPPRVDRALVLLEQQGSIDTARDRDGNVTFPVRYRRRAERPGELAPRTAEAMHRRPAGTP